jgi:hypothetical protein
MICGAKRQNFLNPLVYHWSLVIGHWSLVIGHRQQRASLQRNDQ